MINNFNTLNLRNDIGQLWENYVITERIKKQEYRELRSNNYFWRTYDQKEIDWVEEKEGKLYGYEIKWKIAKSKPPSDWLKTYKEAVFEVVDRANYLKLVA